MIIPIQLTKLKMLRKMRQRNKKYLFIILFTSIIISSCGVSTNHNMIKKTAEIINDTSVHYAIRYIDTLFSDTNTVSINIIKGYIEGSVYKSNPNNLEDEWLFDTLLNNVPSWVSTALHGILFDCTLVRLQHEHIRIRLLDRNLALNNYRLIYALNDNDSTIFANYKRHGCTIFYKEEDIKGYKWIYKLQDKWFLACYDE